MPHTSKFKFLGRTYWLPTRHVRMVHGIWTLVSILAALCLAYLVLTVVDYHLGTTRAGAAILLFALLIELTVNTESGEKTVAILPKWGRDALTAILLVMTLGTFFVQGEVVKFAFVAVVGALPFTQGLAARGRAGQDRKARARRTMAQSLADMGYGKRDCDTDEDRS